MSQELKLDVFALTNFLAFLHRPIGLALMLFVRIFFGNQKLNAIALIFAEINLYLCFRFFKSLADGLAFEEPAIEGMREANCSLIEDFLALQAADDVWHTAF